jgi:hypothetical protein
MDFISTIEPHLTHFKAPLMKKPEDVCNIVSTIQAIKSNDQASLRRMVEAKTFQDWESILVRAMTLELSDDGICALIRGEKIDLIRACGESHASILFRLLSAGRFGLLRKLLSHPELIEANLGILQPIRRQFLQLDRQIMPVSPARPESSTDTVDCRLPKDLWIYHIFPALPLRDQLHLSQVNLRLRTYGSAVVTLLPEFREGFNSLARQPFPISTTEALTLARDTAYAQENLARYRPLFAAVACGEVSETEKQLVNLQTADPDHFKNHINAIRQDELATNPGFAANLLTVSIQADRLAILILLQGFSPAIVKPLNLMQIMATACQWGAVDVIRFLLLADPKQELVSLSKGLDIACCHRNAAIVELLAPAVDQVTLSNYLHEAITRDPKATRTLAALVRHGAVCTKATLLSLCANNTFEGLNAVLTPRQLAEYGPELWRSACVAKRAQTVALLLSRQPNLLAIEDCQQQLLEMLKQSDVEVFYKALESYQIPLSSWLVKILLQFATRDWSVTVIKALIPKYLNINEVPEGSSTLPLVLACQFCSDELINYFLDQGASFHIEAFYHAILVKKTDLIYRLLSLPQATEQIIRAADNPSLIAGCNGNYTWTIQLLKLVPGLQRPSLIHEFFTLLQREPYEITEAHIAILEYLLECNATLLGNDAQGNTLLHLACQIQLGDLMLIDWLLDHKANVNAQNLARCTPLHVACQLGRDDIVARLIECNADVNAIDNMGKTPLHHACESASRNTLCVEHLVNAGANPAVYDNQKKLALEYALAQSLVAPRDRPSIGQVTQISESESETMAAYIMLSPAYVEHGCPGLPTNNAEKLIKHLLMMIKGQEADHQILLNKLFNANLGCFFTQHHETAPLREILTHIHFKTTGHGPWHLKTTVYRRWKLGKLGGEKIMLEGQEYTVPKGIARCIKLIDTLKKLPYPLCLEAVKSTCLEIYKIAVEGAKEDKGFQLFASLHEQDPSTRLFYQNIVAILAPLFPELQPALNVNNNNKIPI